MIEWSPIVWAISVAAVVASALIAWREGNWWRGPHLDLGFANHGGMWGDFFLLPLANAAIVPYLSVGPWLAAAVLATTIASLWVHHHWYRGGRPTHSREHMWPVRRYNAWWRDLSWAGWAHVIYVAAELSLLVGFLLSPMPLATVLFVTAIFTTHVPIGLLQPRWFLTGRLPTLRQQPLLLPCLVALWVVAWLKI
jgi:hypothetical protein